MGSFVVMQYLDRMGILHDMNGGTLIWVNYSDLTVLPSPGIMVNKGNHPKWP